MFITSHISVRILISKHLWLQLPIYFVPMLAWNLRVNYGSSKNCATRKVVFISLHFLINDKFLWRFAYLRQTCAPLCSWIILKSCQSHADFGNLRYPHRSGLPDLHHFLPRILLRLSQLCSVSTRTRNQQSKGRSDLCAKNLSGIVRTDEPK